MRRASWTCGIMTEGPTSISLGPQRERRKREAKTVLEEIVAGNALNLVKDTDLHTQQDKQTPNRIKQKHTNISYLNFWKQKSKEKSWKQSKRNNTYLQECQREWRQISRSKPCTARGKWHSANFLVFKEQLWTVTSLSSETILQEWRE